MYQYQFVNLKMHGYSQNMCNPTSFPERKFSKHHLTTLDEKTKSLPTLYKTLVEFNLQNYKS